MTKLFSRATAAVLVMFCCGTLLTAAQTGDDDGKARPEKKQKAPAGKKAAEKGGDNDKDSEEKTVSKPMKRLKFDMSMFTREMTRSERKELRELDRTFNKVVRSDAAPDAVLAAAEAKYAGYLALFNKLIGRLEKSGRVVDAFKKELKELEEGKDSFLARATRSTSIDIVGIRFRKTVKKAKTQEEPAEAEAAE